MPPKAYQYDIFISYSKKDIQITRDLAVAFEKQGWRVWWDTNLQVGNKWHEEIKNALDQSACVVVLWSENSVKSRWVNLEATAGADRNILVPVLIEEVEIPFNFSDIQARSLVGGLKKFNEEAFVNLCKDIKVKLEEESEVKEVDLPKVPFYRNRYVLASMLFPLLIIALWFALPYFGGDEEGIISAQHFSGHVICDGEEKEGVIVEVKAINATDITNGNGYFDISFDQEISEEELSVELSHPEINDTVILLKSNNLEEVSLNVSSTKVDTSDTDLTEEHSIVHHQPKVFVKNSRSSELEGVLNACSCQLRFDINYTGSILPQIGSDDYYFYEGGRLNIRCKGEIIVEHTIPKIGQFDVLNKDQIKGQLEDWVIEKSGEVLSEIDETKWCND